MRGEKEVRILRIREGEAAEADDLVAVEEPLALHVNGARLVTLLYTPPMALELALGHLLSEGIIASREDVVSFSHRKDGVFIGIRGEVPSGPAERVITSGCGGGISGEYPENLQKIKKITSELPIHHERVAELADDFRKKSRLFEETGGVHSAALSDGAGIIVFAEDIGRHNAADKVFGKCLMDGIDTSDKALLTTGRISSEIVIKAARSSVPVIVSRSAPTSLAVTLAENFGITLVGFARGRRMNVYCHAKRIVK